MSNQYKIRWFEDGDIKAFLELYKSVLGRAKTKEWFSWKYIDNPYTNHVPIVVAEKERELVGARGFMALPMRYGSADYIAYQPCDTMVQHDHRQRGLFTKMTEMAIDRYEDGDVDFFFNFPNDISLKANSKLGWKVVGETPEYYRIENPRRLVSSYSKNRFLKAVAFGIDPLYRGYLSAKDFNAISSEPDLIEHHQNTDLAIENLADFYDQGTIERFHAARDTKFYEWRLANPDWQYEIFTVHNKDKPQGAAVIGHRRELNVQTVSIVDFLPLQPKVEPIVCRSLLETIQSRYTEIDMVIAPCSIFSNKILKRFGFLSKSMFPMNRFVSSTSLVARTLSDDRIVDENDLRNPDEWMLTLIELDTS
ncbi:GNAT family N-acetyltransferase [Halovivax gelatinilyticus]|uniref:GNAT family N-acetyltransferase n=1 Tax=Halovivax gelatinilyticus TaxID=2961597 RepID=UPI0020CA518B|nr:GNAT family N-acetyltransferase [Halovivax gelatinilyticus]